MEVVYVKMESTRHKMTLPVELNTENMSVALFEITGRVRPYTPRQIFLCADFIHYSAISSLKQMPVIRKIRLNRFAKDEDVGRINQNYDKMLWLPVNRSPLTEIELYICNEDGQLAPFETCLANCTLVFVPKKDFE